MTWPQLSLTYLMTLSVLFNKKADFLTKLIWINVKNPFIAVGLIEPIALVVRRNAFKGNLLKVQTADMIQLGQTIGLVRDAVVKDLGFFHADYRSVSVCFYVLKK